MRSNRGQFRVCVNCGCHLDSGERCDCLDKAAEMAAAVKAAAEVKVRRQQAKKRATRKTTIRTVPRTAVGAR